MDAITRLLAWLDSGSNPTHYTTFAFGCFLAVFALAVCPPATGAPPWRRRANNLLFSGGVLLVLAAFRWPVWFWPQPLNPDESQLVAGALTLDRYPIYWKFVDGTTHGPWGEYPLVIAHWFGAPFNYVSARVIAVLLEGGALLAVWGTLRRLSSERVARVAVLPGLAFWSFVLDDDFLHLSTELAGIFFLAAAGWLVAVTLTAKQRGNLHCLTVGLAGVCLGNVAFAKLQIVPQALVLAIFALCCLWRGRPDLAAGQRRRLIASLILGGCLPAVILLGFLGANGLGQEFLTSYILSALEYTKTGDQPLALMPTRFLSWAAVEPAFAWFFWGGLGFSLIYLRARSSGPLRAGLVGTWLLLATASFTVLRPAREYSHYLHLLVIPLTALVGFSFAGGIEEARSQGVSIWRRLQPWLVFALFVLIPQGLNRFISEGNRFSGHFAEHRAQPLSETARFIRERAQLGEMVAMWGWEAHLLVETGMPHGTREPHTAYQIMTWPLQPYYVARYVSDMKRREPAWFVDVVGPKAFRFEDRSTQAHEAVPALAGLVGTHYELVAEFEYRRIYRRKASPIP